MSVCITSEREPERESVREAQDYRRRVRDIERRLDSLEDQVEVLQRMPAQEPDA